MRATLKPPTRKTQDEFVLSLAFDPRGGWLAVGTGAGNVEMWDMATLKLRNKLHVHDVKNYGVLVALMPDGKTLATADARTGSCSSGTPSRFKFAEP